LSTCPSLAHAVLMMEERLGMLQVRERSRGSPIRQAMCAPVAALMT
jgi:hypothetical protein